jgi:hypothetical protein
MPSFHFKNNTLSYCNFADYFLPFRLTFHIGPLTLNSPSATSLTLTFQLVSPPPPPYLATLIPVMYSCSTHLCTHSSAIDFQAHTTLFSMVMPEVLSLFHKHNFKSLVLMGIEVLASLGHVPSMGVWEVVALL